MNGYLALSLLFIVIQGLFAFFEMACVSFNKVRLQYYVSIGTRRALWLEYLLKRPSRLFGTTLIGITTSLCVGSECARRFYESMHINPDWAPLTQVPLIVIFGELVPMFAARRHPEQAAMFCVPLMIMLARILTPITWAFDLLSRIIHQLMGKSKEVPLFLSREEVKMAFEEQEGEDEFNLAVSQIFQLKNRTAAELMVPLSKVQMVSSHTKLRELRHILSVHYVSRFPIFHKDPHNIVAMVNSRDLLRLEDHKKVIDASHSPWFVTKDFSILQLLQQFRCNNQKVAVILDLTGQAVGILTLEQILREIFGEEAKSASQIEPLSYYIERTLSGDMSVAEFNQQFHSSLPLGQGNTLSDLIFHQLGHPPVKDESIRIGSFEFTINEPTLLGIKTLSVRSIND
jgi:putative hemolysin